MAIELEWTGGERFRAVTPEGVEIQLDGGRAAGISPTDALLVAFASCMGIDVVDILTKGRQAPRACRLRVAGERRESPPRRFTRIRLDVRLVGPGISRAKAERAVDLSRTTYCSVWNTLAPDVELEVDLELVEESGPDPA